MINLIFFKLNTFLVILKTLKINVCNKFLFYNNFSLNFFKKLLKKKSIIKKKWILNNGNLANCYIKMKVF